MMKLAATAAAVVFLQAAPAFADDLSGDVAKASPCVEATSPAGGRPVRHVQPALNSSEIAAIQYHEPSTPAAKSARVVLPIDLQQPTDTSRVADGMPGVMWK